MSLCQDVVKAAQSGTDDDLKKALREMLFTTSRTTLSVPFTAGSDLGKRTQATLEVVLAENPTDPSLALRFYEPRRDTLNALFMFDSTREKFLPADDALQAALA